MKHQVLNNLLLLCKLPANFYHANISTSLLMNVIRHENASKITFQSFETLAKDKF